MKVKLLGRKPRIVEVSASYGARLIEQGRAVFAAEMPAPKKAKANGAEGKNRQ